MPRRARMTPALLTPDVTPDEIAEALTKIDTASNAMLLVRRMALQLQTRNRELDGAQKVVDGIRAKLDAAEAEIQRLRSAAPLPVTAVHYQIKKVKEQNGQLVRVVKACAPVVHNIGAPHCPVCRADLESEVLGRKHSAYCMLALVADLPRLTS